MFNKYRPFFKNAVKRVTDYRRFPFDPGKGPAKTFLAIRTIYRLWSLRLRKGVPVKLMPVTKLYTGRFLTIAAANLFMVSSVGAFFMIALFVTDHGGSKTDIGLVMGVMTLSSVVFRPWISELIDRIGRKRSFTVGTAIMTVIPFCYLLFQGELSDYYLPLLLVRLVHGLGIAFCFTSAFTYIADIVPEERLNEGIGMFGTTGLMGMAIGPALGELVISHWGYDAYFVTGGILGAIALLLHQPLPESYRRSMDTGSAIEVSFFSVLKMDDILMLAILAVIFGVGLSSYSSYAAPFAHSLGCPWCRCISSPIPWRPWPPGWWAAVWRTGWVKLVFWLRPSSPPAWACCSWFFFTAPPCWSFPD